MAVSTEDQRIGGERMVFDRSNAKRLLALAQDTTPESRSELIEIVSRLFEKSLNEQEQRLASDVLMSLLRQAESDLKQALSERLAVLDTVPSNLIIALANDEISVAAPVLRQSKILNDIDLVYVVRAKSPLYWQVIAQRDSLGPVIADALIDTGDVQTVFNLVENQGVRFTSGSLKKMVKLAVRSEQLQAPLLRRPEVDNEVAMDLYSCVAGALRREISEKFNVNPVVIERALDQLIDEFSGVIRGSLDVPPELLSIAARFKERGEIDSKFLIRVLRRSQLSFFIALFSVSLGIEPAVVQVIVGKEGGRPLATACKHLKIMKSDFASIFLLSRGVRTGDKVINQTELAEALAAYDTVKVSDVERVLQAWNSDPGLI